MDAAHGRAETSNAHPTIAVKAEPSADVVAGGAGTAVGDADHAALTDDPFNLDALLPATAAEASVECARHAHYP